MYIHWIGDLKKYIEFIYVSVNLYNAI